MLDKERQIETKRDMERQRKTTRYKERQKRQRETERNKESRTDEIKECYGEKVTPEKQQIYFLKIRNSF